MPRVDRVAMGCGVYAVERLRRDGEVEGVDTESESLESRDSVSSLIQAEAAEFNSVCSHMGGTYGA